MFGSRIKRRLKRVEENTNRKLNELIWAEVFKCAVQDSEWFVRRSLCPGRWAMGFPALYVLFRILDNFRPVSILEFGLGESSKMTMQYKAGNPDADLTVIEHDESWKELFCAKYGMAELVKVVPLEITADEPPHIGYKDLLPVIAGRKYDCILVDGPWGCEKDSRDHILDIIEAGLLAEEFVILFDDVHRQGEKDTVDKMYVVLDKKGIMFEKHVYSGEKDTLLVCSPRHKYLCSL